MNAFDHIPPTKIILDEVEADPKLAKRSLILMLIALVMGQSDHELFARLPDAGPAFHLSYIGTFLLAALVALVGSVLALLRHRHYEGVKLPAGCALLGSSFLLVSFCFGMGAAAERPPDISPNAAASRELAHAPQPSSPALVPTTPERRVEIEKNAAAVDRFAADSAALSVDERLVRLDTAAKEMTGPEARIMAVVKSLLSELEETRKRRHQHHLNLRAAGGFSFTNLKTREDIQSRRALLQRYLDEAQQLVKSERTMRERLTQAMTTANIPEDQIRGFFVGWDRGAESHRLRLKYDECDLLGCRDMQGILDLLEQERGEWRLDASSGKLTFNRQAAQTKFLALVEDIQRTNEKMLDVQKEFEMVKALQVPGPRR
jgi:hypothetical protein